MNESFNELFKQAPNIIGKAAESSLGVAVFIVLGACVLAFLLFRDAAGNLKLEAFAITCVVGVLVLVVIVASNSTKIDNSQPKQTEQTKQVRIRDNVLGIWHGQYTCPGGDGETGVELSLTDMTDSGEIRGKFSFYNWLGGSPQGSYLVKGAYDRRANTLRIDPAGWIQQPAGYCN